MAVTVSATTQPIEYKIVVNTDTDTNGGANKGYPNLFGSSATIYAIDIDNSGVGQVTYIHLYNADPITVGTTLPIMTLMALASTRVVYNIPSGYSFSAAVSIAGTTQAGTGNTTDPSSSVTVRITAK
jgi:hypothetical protein